MEQCGPKRQVVRRWSIVSASPQSQFGSSVYPQRAAEALVFPTLHRALLREHHCFLFSAVPFVKVSLAGGRLLLEKGLLVLLQPIVALLHLRCCYV